MFLGDSHHSRHLGAETVGVWKHRCERRLQRGVAAYRGRCTPCRVINTGRSCYPALKLPSTTHCQPIRCLPFTVYRVRFPKAKTNVHRSRLMFHRLLPTVRTPLSTVYHPQSARFTFIFHRALSQSTVHRPPSAVHWPLSILQSPMPVVRRTQPIDTM